MKTEQLPVEQFRQKLFEYLPNRAAAQIELIDGLSSNVHARSPVELSLSPYFHRGHDSIYRAVDELLVFQGRDYWEQTERFELEAVRLLAPWFPDKFEDHFYLFAADATPNPPPYAQTMPDRKFVHQPTLIKGNKPITMGLEYSVLGLLDPKLPHRRASGWFAPLSIREAPYIYKAREIAGRQITNLLTDEQLPFYTNLNVAAADSYYAQAQFIRQTYQLDNFVGISRFRSNRHLFEALPACSSIQRAGLAGRKARYGQEFVLSDIPDSVPVHGRVTFIHTAKKGREHQVDIQRWNRLIMSGQKNMPMHDVPLRLLRISLCDPDTAEAVYAKPMFLVVWGKRALELSLKTIFEAYLRRFDEEHFFRFAKQKLLLTEAQSPEPQRQRNWAYIVMFAYWFLFLSRFTHERNPRPWEKQVKPLVEPQRDQNLPPATPAIVQRAFSAIIPTFEPLAPPPKTRGNSPGAPKNVDRAPRKKHKILKKGKKQAGFDSS